MHIYFITLIIVVITAFFAGETSKSKYQQVSTNIAKSNPFKHISPHDIFVLLTFLILSLVAGLRWRVGTDYWQYSRLYFYFSRIPFNQFFSLSISNLSQLGIRSISLLARLIHDDYTTMFLLCALITIGLYTNRIAKSSKTFLFSILLFIFMGSWHGTFNAVRQHLAIAVIFAGCSFIIQKSFYKYALVVVLASLFHSSALIMLPVYFIAIRKIDYKQWLILTIIAAIMISSYDILFKISEIILDKQIAMFPYMTRRVNILRVFVACAPVVIYIMVKKKYKKDTEYNFYLNMLIINAMLRIGTMNSAYLMRIASYTGIFSTIAIPRILECFNKKSALLMKFVITSLYFIFWYVEISNDPSLYNFKWIFQR